MDDLLRYLALHTRWTAGAWVEAVKAYRKAGWSDVDIKAMAEFGPDAAPTMTRASSA